MSKETKKRKSLYNEDRDHYLTKDGKYYCYKYFDVNLGRVVTQRLEVGKGGLSIELSISLDEDDHDTDLGNRYEDELKSPVFEAKKTAFESGDPDAVEPWDDERLSSPDTHEVLYGDEDITISVESEIVIDVVENHLTEEQKTLFYKHFGEGKQLEEIRKEEAEATGEEKSLQSVLNRKNKIIRKVAKKGFGVEPVKRHKYPKKD